VTDAAAYLAVLGELGADMREREAGHITAPKSRATLRDSPFGELFRATGQRRLTGPAAPR